jgi:hypothetical protein
MNRCYALSRCRFIRCPPRRLAVEDLLTQLLRRYAPMHREIIRCWWPRGQNLSGSFHATVGWTAAHASVHPVLKALFWRVSVLFKCVHWIDQRLPPMDRRFIWRCCSSQLLSAIRPKLLKTGPSVHLTVLWFSPSVPTRLIIAPTLVI